MNRAAGREVAELYFARFEARLEKGLAEVRSEARAEHAAIRAEMKEGFAVLRTEMANQRAELIKWMFIFWAGTVIPLAGLAIALIKL